MSEFPETGVDETALVSAQTDQNDPAGEGDAPGGANAPGTAALEESAPPVLSDLRDPEPDPVDPAPPAGELEGLRQELNGLRRELDFLRRAQTECAEFAELYPKVSLSDLPDAVWKEVERGIPISAAYALFERREARAKKIAEESNEQNRARSAGALSGARAGYLSPAEVRAMSPAEVRKNYQNILRSMQKWN